MSEKTLTRRWIQKWPGRVNLPLMAIAAAVVVIAGCNGSQSSTASQPSSGSQTASTPNAQSNVASVRYVALGDSFSSGEGNAPFLPGTEVSNGDECHRSPLGYAMQLHNLSGPALALPDFLACSGAQIQDLFSANHESNNANTEPPQVRRLSPLVGLVTMTMGGNNLGRGGNGLGDLLEYCVLHHGPCHQDLEAGVTDKLHFIDGTRPGNTNPFNLQRVYEKLRWDAPNARILVAGYPHEFTGAYADSCEHIDTTDQAWMNQVVDSLNSVIKANIQAANKTTGARIEYVDAIPWFTGHALDNGSTCSWVGQAFNSTSVNDLSHKEGFFHPNVLGQNLYARAFMKELRRPAPAANPSPACSSQTFLSVVMSKGYAQSVAPSGTPTCADGYALETFVPYADGQEAQFFFKQDASGYWTIIEEGDAVPTIACSTIPVAVLTKLGAQCPAVALTPTTSPSPTSTATGECSSAVFLRLMQSQGATVTSASGPPKCLNGYAEQNFNYPKGPTANYPTFFFHSDSHGGWTILGGGAIGDTMSVCSKLPASVRTAFVQPARDNSGCPSG